MDMNMGGAAMSSSMPSGSPDLSDASIDMSNFTVAYDFLQDVLVDSELQPFDDAVARAFWYGIVIVIVLAGIGHWARWATLKARLRAAASKRPRPASPSNPLTSIFASCTAVFREASYRQYSPLRISWIRIPPVGCIILILIYLGFILGLQFYEVDYPGAQHWQAQGLRAGWLAIAQLPLVLLLTGKNNLIGYAVGMSYERLNVLHRWVARAMLLTATLHGGFQAYGWNEYGVLHIEISTDACIPTGFATWIILIWIVFSSMTPIRNWRYEIFLVQHIISFIGFIVAIFYHIPASALSARIYAWIAIGLFVFDRLVRTLRYGVNNAKPGRAMLTSLPDNVTKIRLQSSRIKKWSPGQHVFLSIPKLGTGQSHPATIASVPSSHGNDLVFILRAHRGFTKRLFHKAASSSTADLLPKVESGRTQEQFLALVDGPYGASHSDFAAFDSVLLIAGSTGVTFTLSILLDLAHRASTQRLPVRRLMFVWMVKSASWTQWVADELQQAVDALINVGIDAEIQIFVTCDPTLSDTSPTTTSVKEAGCKCHNTKGPCCCSDTASSMADKGRKTVTSSQESQRRGDVPSSPPTLPVASGRPQMKPLLWGVLDKAEGETGVAVCGPMGLTTCVRNTVAAVSEQRGASKGTGAEGVYLHAECFAW